MNLADCDDHHQATAYQLVPAEEEEESLRKVESVEDATEESIGEETNEATTSVSISMNFSGIDYQAFEADQTIQAAFAKSIAKEIASQAGVDAKDVQVAFDAGDWHAFATIVVHPAGGVDASAVLSALSDTAAIAKTVSEAIYAADAAEGIVSSGKLDVSNVVSLKLTAKEPIDGLMLTPLT
jgi:hypothetical protein